MPTSKVHEAPPNWRERARQLPGAKPVAATLRPPAPSLATLAKSPPRGDDWTAEIKWDGYRLFATLVDGVARLWSRHGVDWTARLIPIANAIIKLPVATAVLDGELIAASGRQADFNLLQETIARRSTTGLTFVAFDLINLDGIDITRAPLLARRELLRDLLRSAPARIAFSTHIPGRSAEALAATAKNRFEGVVFKRAASPYTAGRTTDWLKVKNDALEEVAVVGLLRESAGDGLHLLIARPEGGTWRYAGRIRVRASEWNARLGPPHSTTPTVASTSIPAGSLMGATWFAPRYVIEVDQRAAGTSSGFRQPKFVRLLDDKRIEDLQ